jgi:threonine aldolase
MSADGAQAGTKLPAVSSSRGFASDNNATVHPAVLAAIARANVGHATGYGHDEFTKQVEAKFTEHFGADARPFFVFNGTAANVLSMRAMCRPWEAVVCAQTAHLNVDECGAPEAIAGVKLLTATTKHGKLTPELVQRMMSRLGDEHVVQPRVVSISQCTELGTLYSRDEVRAIAEFAHANRMLLHMDGSRLSNAAAAMKLPLAAISTDVGVDVLSFGGTKNGLLGGEAVVFLNPELSVGFEYLRKQTLQLASKMRFIAAQFDALLTDDLWQRCAGQANAMAADLAKGLDDVAQLTITRPVETNAVFATLPAAVTEELQAEFPFYVWDEQIGEVRWMCSWDTTEDDVDDFVSAVRSLLE